MPAMLADTADVLPIAGHIGPTHPLRQREWCWLDMKHWCYRRFHCCCQCLSCCWLPSDAAQHLQDALSHHCRRRVRLGQPCDHGSACELQVRCHGLLHHPLEPALAVRYSPTLGWVTCAPQQLRHAPSCGAMVCRSHRQQQPLQKECELQPTCREQPDCPFASGLR